MILCGMKFAVAFPSCISYFFTMRKSDYLRIIIDAPQKPLPATSNLNRKIQSCINPQISNEKNKRRSSQIRQAIFTVWPKDNLRRFKKEIITRSLKMLN